MNVSFMFLLLLLFSFIFFFLLIFLRYLERGIYIYIYWVRFSFLDGVNNRSLFKCFRFEQWWTIDSPTTWQWIQCHNIHIKVKFPDTSFGLTRFRENQKRQNKRNKKKKTTMTTMEKEKERISDIGSFNFK